MPFFFRYLLTISEAKSDHRQRPHTQKSPIKNSAQDAQRL